MPGFFTSTLWSHLVLVGLIDAGLLYEYFMESVPVGLIDAQFLYEYFR